MAGIRSAMRSPMRSPMARAMGDAYVSLAQQALAILRRYGTDAHVYLPGANGVAVSGLLTNNYTSSDGSTGYSSVDGVAGLVLDAMGSKTNYNPATVPTYSYDGTGASTVVRTGASLTFTSAPSGDGIRLAPIFGVSDTFSFCKFTASGSGSLVVYAGGSPTTFTLTGTPTQYQCGTAANGSQWVVFRSNSANMSASITINEISAVSGIHATQATTANKPAERRGLYNLLTYSNDLTNAAWIPEFTASKSGSNILTPAVGDDVYHGTTVAAGSYTLAAQLSGSGTCSLFAYNTTNNIHGVTQITLASTPTIFAANITSTVADTFYYIGRRFGDTATSITFGGAGLFAGTLTASQILAEGGIPLTTSTAASGTGKGWWGVNDSLTLGSVPFQMADDHCVIASLGLGANATTRYAVNSSVGAGSQRVGALFINSSNNICAGWTDDVAAANIISPSAYTGQTVVAACVKQINAKRLRVNGAQAGATDNTVMGTTTLTTGGAIGDWRPGGGNLWIGSIGPVIVIKGTVSDADILTLERWVASLTPNAPSF